MIALKTDPIWVRISRFGRPFPPFDFNSGMGLRNIGREGSDEPGLTQPGKPVPTEWDGAPSENTPEGFAAKLERSVKDLRPEWREALEEHFPGQIASEGDIARWRTNDSRGSPIRTKPIPPVAQPVPGRGLPEEPGKALPVEAKHIKARVEIASILSPDGRLLETIRGTRTGGSDASARRGLLGRRAQARCRRILIQGAATALCP
jgi:hypothetical protein